MNPYEVLLMLDPELADERQAEIIERAQEIVTNSGGDWLRNDRGAAENSPMRSTTRARRTTSCSPSIATRRRSMS